MLVRANVVFIGCKQESFKAKSGKDVSFQRVNFVPDGSEESMSLTALMDLDFSHFDKFCNLELTFDFYTDARSGYLKGKIVGIN